MESVIKETAISMQGISKYYKYYEKEIDRAKEIFTGRPFYQKIEALKETSLDVSKGEVLGVIGQNGAGKSTLLKVLSKTLLPSTGEIEINGRIAALLELGASFHPDMTGKENVYLSGAIQGLNTKDIDRIYGEVIDFAEIGDFINRPVKTYSSGMFVRLAFSVATHIDPEILIIDEALSVGDGAFSRKSFDRIMDFKDAGKTILFCSHSMYQVEVLCDRVVWLENGAIRKMGKPVEVITEYTELLRMAAPKEESIASTNKVEKEKFQNELDEKKVNNIPSIREVRVSADGVDGKVHKIDSEKSNLEVNVIFDIGEGVPLASVAVAISRGDGRIITSAGSVHDGVTLSTNEAGHGVAKLLFPQLPLLRGNYFLDVALLCEKGIHLYESVRQAAEFNVEQKGLERGIVKLPHEWLE
jgi:lipopolysaccharide transport system ATP-binding protein